ncbi:hypothetical protein K439DRAFT_1293367, partial [Ramaria rubella]
ICLATSTDTEHAFSGSGLTVSQMHHSLLDESTHAASILSLWAAVGEVIPEEVII